jgi:aminoglycoside 6'-N-acetyltransferase
MAPPEAQPIYDFRAATEADLPTIAGWLGEPHVARWWGGAENEISSIRGHIDSDAVEPLIVELARRPVAYLQSYDPHLEDDHPYADQPFGTLGIDLFIGPPDLTGMGHGPAIITQFTEALFEEGAPRVIADPHPDNRRAVRAYEKAGFHSLGERSSHYGRVLLMAIDSPEGNFEQ